MKLAHITIHTGKKDKEIAFYKKYAGLDAVRDMGNITFLGNGETGETLIEIIEDNDNPYEGKNLSLGFSVEDASAYREELLEEGLDPTPVISPAPVVKFFFVKDPAGVSVQFIEQAAVILS